MAGPGSPSKSASRAKAYALRAFHSIPNAAYCLLRFAALGIEPLSEFFFFGFMNGSCDEDDPKKKTSGESPARRETPKKKTNFTWQCKAQTFP